MKFHFLLLVAAITTVAVADEKPAPEETDARAAAALTAAGLTYTVDGGDFRLEYELDGGRSQLVWVASGTARLDRLEYRDVWTVAARGRGEVPTETARLLLKENARMVLGGWAVNQGKDEYLVVFTAQVGANAEPTALQEVIEVVALSADRIEKQLSATDEF